MALIKNPDGSVTVSDDTGRVPTFVVPAETAATLLPPQPAPLRLSIPSAAPPVAAPQLLPEPTPMPAGLTLDQPVPGLAPQALSDGAVAGEGGGLQPVPGANYGISPNQKIMADRSAKARAASGPTQIAAPPTPAPVRMGVTVSADDELRTVDQKTLAGNAPSAAPSAVGAAPVPEPYDGDVPSAVLANEYAFEPGGYSPGRPARDVKKSFQVQKGIKTSPETLGLIKTAFANRAGIENEGARAVPEALDQVALAHARAADAAQQEITAIRNRQRAQEAELQNRMKVFDSHIARVNNMADRDIMGEYLNNQNLGTRIIVGLSAMASALTHSPDTVAERIKMELNGALQQQKMRVEAGHQTAADMLSAYGQMRSTYTSPEAAESAAQALMLQATQQTVLQAAARVTSEETRIKYLDVAGQLGIEYALLRQATEQSEADRITESWKHDEAVAGGYKAPRLRSMRERIQLAKKDGVSLDQIMELTRGNKMPDKGKGRSRGETDLMKFVYSSRVRLPGGEVMYTDPSRAKAAEGAIRDGTLFYDTAEQIKKIGDGNLTTLAGTDRAKVGILVNENLYYLKTSLIREALTASEGARYENMSGADMLHWLTTDASATAALTQAQKGAQRRIEAEKKTLDTMPPGFGESSYAKQAAPPAGAVKTDD